MVELQPYGRALIFSAPSGSGKTTIIERLRALHPEFSFSVSATSREPREGEVDGKNYYFLSADRFMQRVERGDFLEWEEVYAGTYYGTLRVELQRLWSQGCVVLFDVDVKGAQSLKRALRDGALSIFIEPPSLEVLRARLEARGSESAESLQKRLARAEMEMAQADTFDHRIVNDNLEQAVAETLARIEAFLDS